MLAVFPVFSTIMWWARWPHPLSLDDKIFFAGLCAHFIAFWHVSTDSKVHYPER
jgi:hypothetical protein